MDKQKYVYMYTLYIHTQWNNILFLKDKIMIDAITWMKLEDIVHSQL